MNAAPCSCRVRMKRISGVSRSTSRIGRFIVPGMPNTCSTRSRRRQSTTACAPVIISFHVSGLFCRGRRIKNEERNMRWVIGTGVAAMLAACAAQLSTQDVSIGASDIGGIVTSAAGPEAGVWVIAETTELPTKYAKMVVTDERGRYVVPGLPKATYSVWVRGYGLVDSPKVRAQPGKLLNLTAVPAPSEAAAAQYYPAIYWYSMLQIPPASDFGGGTR